MKRKRLKRIIVCLGVLTIVMCTGLYFMSIQDSEVSTSVQTPTEQPQQETQNEIIKGSALDENKLNIELPEMLTKQDIQIVNDYVNHTIHVRFTKVVDNYLQEYRVQGNRNHIVDISYYKDGESGVLEIKLDQACEYSDLYIDGFLSMEIKSLHEVYEKVVVIDAGHGGGQPGAVENEVYEKHLNLKIVQKLKELLDEVDEKKLKAFYTRLEDFDPSLEDRFNMANQLNADLFISVHNNAAPNESYNHLKGTMVLYSQRQSDDQSKRLAQICLENVYKSTGSENAGLAKGDEIYIIRKSMVPVALIEVGYMTNTEEIKNLCDDKYQRKVAQGIYNAIMQAFEEGF